ETIRCQLLVDEASRAAHELDMVDAISVYLRPAIGLPQQELRLNVDQLGFLADSYDPDMLNRLLTVERQFTCMVDLIHRHHKLHHEFQDRMSRADPTGQRKINL